MQGGGECCLVLLHSVYQGVGSCSCGINGVVNDYDYTIYTHRVSPLQ